MVALGIYCLSVLGVGLQRSVQSRLDHFRHRVSVDSAFLTVAGPNPIRELLCPDPKAQSSWGPVAGRPDKRSPRPVRGRFGERRRRLTPADDPPESGLDWIRGMPEEVRLSDPSSGAGGPEVWPAGPEAGAAAKPPGRLRDGLEGLAVVEGGRGWPAWAVRG